jgi:trigger factor
VKLTVERLPESQLLLDIVADEKVVNEAMDRAYRTVSRQVRVPGFRPGKAPRNVIDRLYGREIYMEEAHRVVVDKLYREAVKQEEIIPVGQPSVEITEVEPLSFKVTVPVFPTIEVGDYQSVRVDPRDAAVNESDVEEVLSRLQKSNSPWVAVEEDRNPVEGDQITIDLSVSDNGEEFDKPIEDAKFIIGESNLFDQLRTVIEGMKVGETAETEISFGEDDPDVNERVRGKALGYTIILKGIEERPIAELNDEFAQSAAGIDTLEGLRDAIRADVHQGKTTETRNAVFSEIIDKIAEGATLDLPSVMIDDAVTEEIKATEQRLSQQGLTIDAYLRMQGQTEDDLREELRPGVARRLRNSLLLREIAEKEGIAVVDEDIDAEIAAITSGSENSQQLRDLYGKEGYFRRMLRDDLFDRKLTDRVVELATEGKGAVVNGFVEPEVTAEGDEIIEATGEVSEPMGIAAEPEAAEETAKKPARSRKKATEETAAETELPQGATAGDGTSDCPDGFPLKGNASSKLYHAPGTPSYEATIPEMCFATEEDAVAAGYSPSKATQKAKKGSVEGDGTADCPSGYPLKGNSSSMLYHAPGTPSYDATVPEMCFASDEDAVTAGYKPSKATQKANES